MPEAVQLSDYELKIKRVYEAPDPEDGLRVLVDRLWPRGLKKDEVREDLWLKEIAPSNALRKWFGHEPSRWIEFRKRYFAELDAKPDLIRDLQEKLAEQDVTFVYAAADGQHNNAQCLRDYLKSRLTR